MIDISIIIVNYNVKDYLVTCLQSINKYSPSKLSTEIIVIDNNSKDGSVEYLNNNFPKIILIINKSNEGFSKGVNHAFKSASGKYLFILNPDTYLLNDSLSILYNFMEEKEEIGILGPGLFSSSMKYQQSYWRTPTLINTSLSLMHLDFFNFHKNYSFQDRNEVETISGGALFVKYSIFETLNGFDNNLFWMEDIDFCYRTSKLGYKIYYLPSAKIVHHKGRSAEKNLSLAIFNQLNSKIKYFKKHHSKTELSLLKSLILLISFLKVILFSFFSFLNGKFSYTNKVNGYKLVIKTILKRN
jgi:hypothetical protein